MLDYLSFYSGGAKGQGLNGKKGQGARSKRGKGQGQKGVRSKRRKAQGQKGASSKRGDRFVVYALACGPARAKSLD